MGNNSFDKIEELKKKIYDNIIVNDDAVCGFCDELIFVSKNQGDLQGVAFGYVWRADHFFYVKSDMKAVYNELEYAQKYIDKDNPTELLEKYYTLKYVLYETWFDIKTAFNYCVKALNIAVELDIKHRIGAHYGNISTYFLDCNLYEEALLYSNKAIEVLRPIKDVKPGILRILLVNLTNIYLKLNKVDKVKPVIEELSQLPIEEKDLKIYVVYSYMLYYAKIKNNEKTLFYLDEMLGCNLMDFPNRVYVIEFLTNALASLMLIEDKEKFKEVLKIIQDYIKDDEYGPLLALSKLKIEYSQKYEDKEALYKNYCEYCSAYLNVQKQINQLMIEGLRTKVELHSTIIGFDLSKKELSELEKIVNFDELTQVYNRRYYNIKQEEFINNKTYVNMGLAIVDIDYFKEYNDFYGHLAGDEVLKQVAAILQKNVNPDLSVFRYGGDEFVCLYRGDNSQKIEEYIVAVKNDLIEANIAHQVSKCTDRVTLSIGYGCRPILTKVDAFKLFDEVDQALFEAKRLGRNKAISIFYNNLL